MMDDELLSDPKAIEWWIHEHTYDPDPEGSKRKNEARIECFRMRERMDTLQRKRIEEQQKRLKEMKEQQEQQHYPRIVVNWSALKILTIFMIICLILMGVFRTLTEIRILNYEKKHREKVEALTANTTTTTIRETTQNAVVTTTVQVTSTKKTTTLKKITTRKKTTTKKDKYNVYDYTDPEDFYDDNRDDFWDYEDAEDYYIEKHRE